jgi:hypothetical protein
MWHYAENREKYMLTQRVPKGFQDAVNVMEELVKKSASSTSSVCIIICPSIVTFCGIV